MQLLFVTCNTMDEKKRAGLFGATGQTHGTASQLASCQYWHKLAAHHSPAHLTGQQWRHSRLRALAWRRGGVGGKQQPITELTTSQLCTDYSMAAWEARGVKHHPLLLSSRVTPHLNITHSRRSHAPAWAAAGSPCRKLYGTAVIYVHLQTKQTWHTCAQAQQRMSHCCDCKVMAY